MRRLGTLGGDTRSGAGKKAASMAQRGKGLACRDTGMTCLSCSHCSQLKQIYVPLPDPSWGRDLQTVPQQAPRERDPALPQQGGQSRILTSSCASSCATRGHAVFTGLSPGETRQRDCPSTRCGEGTQHHQAARRGEGDIAG